MSTSETVPRGPDSGEVPELLPDLALGFDARTMRAEDVAPTFDALALGKLAFRRWYVVLVGIVITSAVALLVARDVQPTYEMTAPYLISSPQFRGDAADLQLRKGTLAGSIAASLNVGGVSGRILDDATDATYQVMTSGEEGVIEVLSNSPDAEQSARIVARVMAAIVDLADLRQEELQVPVADRFVARTLSQPDVTTGEGIETVNVEGSETVSIQAVGAILLESPLTSNANPYSSPSLTFRVIEEVLEAPNRVGQVARGDSSYDLSRLPRDTAPIFYVTAQGSDVSDTLATFEGAVAASQAVLDSRQEGAGIPQTRRITLEALSQPISPLLLSNNLVRPLAVIVGLGGIVALSLAVAVDAVARRRRPGRR